MPTPDVAVSLLDLAESLHAQALAGIAAYDARGDAEIDGYSDAAAWWVATRRCERGEALGVVSRARLERDFDDVAGRARLRPGE